MAKLILNKKELEHLKRNGYEAEDIKIFKKKREHEIETKIYNIDSSRWSLR